MQFTLNWIPPTCKKYERFEGTVDKLCWGNHSKKLPKQAFSSQLLDSGDRELADKLVLSIETVKSKNGLIWLKTFTSKNKAARWNIEGDNRLETREEDKISPNKILPYTSEAPWDRTYASKEKKDMEAVKETCAKDLKKSTKVSVGEITNALRSTKIVKALEFDSFLFSEVTMK